MQTNTGPTKVSNVVSNAINTLMVTIGTLSFIWVLAFLIVAMFGNWFCKEISAFLCLFITLCRQLSELVQFRKSRALRNSPGCFQYNSLSLFLIEECHSRIEEGFQLFFQTVFPVCCYEILKYILPVSQHQKSTVIVPQGPPGNWTS